MKSLVLLSSLAFVAGCATTTNTSTADKSTPPVASAKLQEKAKSYKDSVHSVSEAEVPAGQCYRHAVAMKTQWDWKKAVEAANFCMRAKDYQRVEELGNELAVREPGAPWGPYYLGLAAREAGNMERAEWMTELALKRAPEVGVLHYLKAQILWNKKEYKPAVQSFEKCVELDANNLPAHLFLGQIYFRDQNFDKATKHFYTVIKQDPRNALALSGLAESQLQLKNPQSALDAYTRLAEAYPRDGQYLGRIGEIYEGVLNDPANALTAYRQVQAGARAGRITKNVDPQTDSKIRELEKTLQPTRAVASHAETKTRGAQ